ncbi:hypothetical protein [Nocardioides sp.]|uniref:hypothetical protein n=1 Tax=Nocardioides sp. TaxID=35761 RepID=UPI001A1C1F0E|nr:hypothetical protein [Nocardioides sp.]MBJ7358201.1 hypothetical protein [Nocardioides sp.]
MAHKSGGVLLRVLLLSAPALVAAVLLAQEWGRRERAGWEPDGDPDGESLVQVGQFVVGAGVLLAAALVITLLEMGIWLFRRKSERDSAAVQEELRVEAIRRSGRSSA